MTSNEQKYDVLAVTSVEVYPFQLRPRGTVKAMATVVLNNQFFVRGLLVMNGSNGLFVSYPNGPFYKGEEYKMICGPITRQLREHIENCVLEKYQAAIA